MFLLSLRSFERSFLSCLSFYLVIFADFRTPLRKMVHHSFFVSLLVACFVPLSLCYPVDSDLGSGSGAGDHRPAHPKVTIPCKPKVVDHSRGVYMHAHPNFPNLPGAPGGAFHAQYMHSAGGIGKSRKRSLRESMMEMFKIRTH